VVSVLPTANAQKITTVIMLVQKRNVGVSLELAFMLVTLQSCLDMNSQRPVGVCVR